MPNVLIAGVSTRAAADSAARAGYSVTAVDAFGDLDQSTGVRGLSIPRDVGVPFTAAAAARVAQTIAWDAVAYVSPFENHPRAVRTLARGRTLLGNPPEVLRRVRDPLLLAETFEHRELPAPAVIPSGGPKGRSRGIAGLPVEGPLYRDTGDSSSARHAGARLGMTSPPQLPTSRARGLGMTPELGSTSWLLKPRRSGGGHGIRGWTPGDPIPRSAYVQERIDGTPGSIVFVAARGRAVPLGLTRQIVGDPAFGASGFQYCGNVLIGSDVGAIDPDGTLRQSAITLATAVTEEFGLVGVNGIDFVARSGTPFPVEVNPRYSASMELVERACDVCVFGLHAAACMTGDLPPFDLHRATEAPVAGKSIVFARETIICGDTREWLGDPTVRDIPHPGERIPAGHPVCTVFADGTDTAACLAALVRRAEGVYEALEAWATAGV